MNASRLQGNYVSTGAVKGIAVKDADAGGKIQHFH